MCDVFDNNYRHDPVGMVVLYRFSAAVSFGFPRCIYVSICMYKALPILLHTKIYISFDYFGSPRDQPYTSVLFKSSTNGDYVTEKNCSLTRLDVCASKLQPAPWQVLSTLSIDPTDYSQAAGPSSLEYTHLFSAGLAYTDCSNYCCCSAADHACTLYESGSSFALTDFLLVQSQSNCRIVYSPLVVSQVHTPLLSLKH